MNYDTLYFTTDKNGERKLRPAKEREQLREEMNKQQAEVSRRLAERKKPTGPVSPYATRISELEQEVQSANFLDRPSIERRLNHLRKQHAEFERQTRDRERREQYSNDRGVQPMREHSALIASGDIIKDRDDIAELVAIANLEPGDMTIEEHVSMYWTAEERAKDKRRQELQSELVEKQKAQGLAESDVEATQDQLNNLENLRGSKE